MFTTCPGCGYGPIGPFTDNCPLCAAPTHGGGCDEGGGVAVGPMRLSPWLLVGWLGIGVGLWLLFPGDWPWLLLSLVLCGTAWWAVVRAETLLLRLLGGSLLLLFVPGVWLAAQPEILPGLDRREQSPERVISEVVQAVKGTSPESLRTAARMKTVSGAIYAMHAVVAVPLALLVPPLLSCKRRRQLGGPVFLSKAQAVGGLCLWLVALPLLGWLSWPAVQGWAETPNNGMPLNWPAGHWPGGQPADSDDRDEPG
jgi:hypothetical protein